MCWQTHHAQCVSYPSWCCDVFAPNIFAESNHTVYVSRETTCCCWCRSEQVSCKQYGLRKVGGCAGVTPLPRQSADLPFTMACRQHQQMQPSWQMEQAALGLLLCMVLDDQFSLELTCRMGVQLAMAQGIAVVCVEVCFFFSGGDEHSALITVMRLVIE